MKKDNELLSSQVTDKYDQNNDELFKALNEKIKDLEKALSKYTQLYNKTNDAKKKSDMELQNIKKMLSDIATNRNVCMNSNTHTINQMSMKIPGRTKCP